MAPLKGGIFMTPRSWWWALAPLEGDTTVIPIWQIKKNETYEGR